MRGGPPRRTVELSSWPAPMAADGAPGNGAATEGSLGPGTGETRGPATDLLDVTNPGVWMAHCHIAEHHESGMMFSFNVAPADGD